jgi:hypothetical protein
MHDNDDDKGLEEDRDPMHSTTATSISKQKAMGRNSPHTRADSKDQQRHQKRQHRDKENPEKEFCIHLLN